MPSGTATPGKPLSTTRGHVPSPAPRRDPRGRLSHDAHGHFRCLVRILRPVARAPTHSPYQRHVPPARRVDRAAGRRSRGPRRRRRATDSRPRQHLRVGVLRPREKHGCRAARHRPAIALAERVRRTLRRDFAPRAARPRDRARWSAHLLRLVQQHASYYNEDHRTCRSTATRRSRAQSNRRGVARSSHFRASVGSTTVTRGPRDSWNFFARTTLSVTTIPATDFRELFADATDEVSCARLVGIHGGDVEAHLHSGARTRATSDGSPPGGSPSSNGVGRGRSEDLCHEGLRGGRGCRVFWRGDVSGTDAAREAVQDCASRSSSRCNAPQHVAVLARRPAECKVTPVLPSSWIGSSCATVRRARPGRSNVDRPLREDRARDRPRNGSRC